MKKTYTLHSLIDPTIQVGDRVKMFDGSALSLKDDKRDLDFYVTDSYPELTGLDLNLQAINGTVTEVNVTNKVIVPGNQVAYLQDIVVRIGDVEFRTASKLVTKQS